MNLISCFTILVSILTGCISETDKHLTQFEEALGLFAETVLEYGRDHYGEEATPLFADGLNVTSLEPARCAPYMDDQPWVINNFAGQQSLMRFLDGMTGLTGEVKYRKAAEEAADYFLKNALAPNGLPFWGGHSAWNLEKNQPVGIVHEMKKQQPYYELMWRANPEKTRRLLNSIWAHHILDWELLYFNRHAGHSRHLEPKWSSDFKDDIKVPIEIKGRSHSFAMSGLSISQAGVALAVLDNNRDALKWTERLVYRWQQAKHPETGLSGGELTYRGPDEVSHFDGSAPKPDRALIAFGHVHPNINEANMIATYHRSSRYHTMTLAQMQTGLNLLDYGEPYSSAGQRFIDWALDDLKIYGELAYDPEKKVFHPLVTDGSKLKWQEVRGGVEGSGSNNYYLSQKPRLGPFIPNGEIFWSYALAYRLSEDPSHWKMAREIALAMNLGDLGEIGDKGLSIGSNGLLNKTLEDHLNSDNWAQIIYSTYALLELYKATGNKSFLQAASNIGIALVDRQAENGLFPRTGKEYARTSDEVALVILHLAAAISEKTDVIPCPMRDEAPYDMDFYNKELGKTVKYDHTVLYGL